MFYLNQLPDRYQSPFHENLLDYILINSFQQILINLKPRIDQIIKN